MRFKLHIECNGCRKDIPQALWIYYPERFEKVPFCIECYQKEKENFFKRMQNESGK